MSNELTEKKIKPYIKIKGTTYIKIDYCDKYLLISYDYVKDKDGNVLMLTWDEAKKYNPPTKEQYRIIKMMREQFSTNIRNYKGGAKDPLGEEWTASSVNDTFGYYYRHHIHDDACGVYSNVKDYRYPCRKSMIMEKEHKHKKKTNQ